MRQHQQRRSEGITEGQRHAARHQYRAVQGRAWAVVFLAIGAILLALVLSKAQPISNLSALVRILWTLLLLPTFLSTLYARWVCRQKEGSLERVESATWRRKSTDDTSTIKPFSLGKRSNTQWFCGLMGTIFASIFLAAFTWAMVHEKWLVGIQPGNPLLLQAVGVLLLVLFVGGIFALLLAFLLMSLAALRSAGELVRVDHEGISWVRGGIRHKVPWSRLARAEVTSHFDFKGDLVKLQLHFFDNEDQPRGTLAFGGEAPKALSGLSLPWNQELEAFSQELHEVFETETPR